MCKQDSGASDDFRAQYEAAFTIARPNEIDHDNEDDADKSS